MLSSTEVCIREVQRSILELFIPGSPRGKRGQELIEYALIAGFIAVTVAAVVPYSVTAPISAVFNKIELYMKTWCGA